MSRLFVIIGLSLDGYMAPEGMSLEHWSNPEYKNWGANWGALMSWVLKLQYFRENLKFGPGGETGPVNDMFRHTMERSGASIMGKRMFEQARAAAGSRDIRISGGANVIQQYLNLGVIEELEIALAPVMFGSGRRLFENLQAPLPQFRIQQLLHGSSATHLRYVRE